MFGGFDLTVRNSIAPSTYRERQGRCPRFCPLLRSSDRSRWTDSHLGPAGRRGDGTVMGPHGAERRGRVAHGRVGRDAVVVEVALPDRLPVTPQGVVDRQGWGDERPDDGAVLRLLRSCLSAWSFRLTGLEQADGGDWTRRCRARSMGAGPGTVRSVGSVCEWIYSRFSPHEDRRKLSVHLSFTIFRQCKFALQEDVDPNFAAVSKALSPS